MSLLEGITARANQAGVSVAQSTDPADADGADLVIIPIAMAHEDEGEALGGGGDRDDLTLSGAHPAHWGPSPASFISEVAAVNPNVVVLLMVGGAVLVEDFLGDTRALVQTFYPGQEAGDAVASLLFGDINFQGKLPFTVGRAESDYPIFGNALDEVNVDYLHGYEAMETQGVAPRYWFGHGLSYTTFAYTSLDVLCREVSVEGALMFQVTVENTGNFAGTEVVQAYVGYPNTAQRRPVKELVGFEAVFLEPGESRTLTFTISTRDFSFFDEASGWSVERVAHELIVASSSDPTAENRLAATFFVD